MMKMFHEGCEEELRNLIHLRCRPQWGGDATSSEPFEPTTKKGL